MPNHAPAIERVNEVLSELGMLAEVADVRVSDAATAKSIGFLRLTYRASEDWTLSRPHEAQITLGSLAECMSMWHDEKECRQNK
jgi:hypothetical protein